MNSHFYYGLSDEVALVIAGLHGSELSAIEVAHWMRVKLEQKTTIPRYTTILIPEVYPKQAQLARNWRIKNRFTKIDDDKNTGRSVHGGSMYIDPNRQFPKPGEPLSSLTDKTAGGLALLPETRELISIIEMAKPTRIASLHAKQWRSGRRARKGIDAPGIFVDPRYEFDETKLEYFPDQTSVDKYNANSMKFDESIDPAFDKKPGKKTFPSAKTEEGREDDKLGLSVAEAIFTKRPDLVPGNHFDKPFPPVVHYAASRAPANPGFSLGDWAPVRVEKQGDPGARDGIPDVTVEVYQQYESWAFIEGVQFYQDTGEPIPSKPRPVVPGTNNLYPFDPARAKSLQLYADAILSEFLGVAL